MICHCFYKIRKRDRLVLPNVLWRRGATIFQSLTTRSPGISPHLCPTTQMEALGCRAYTFCEISMTAKHNNSPYKSFFYSFFYSPVNVCYKTGSFQLSGDNVVYNNQLIVYNILVILRLTTESFNFLWCTTPKILDVLLSAYEYERFIILFWLVIYIWDKQVDIYKKNVLSQIVFVFFNSTYLFCRNICL